MANEKSDLICDLAETYGIHDYRKVPVHMLGTFAAGLGHDSRIGMKRRGVKAHADVFILAQLYELIFTIAWRLAGKDEELPELPIDEFIIGGREKAKKELKGYTSANDFKEARKKILKEIKNGN